MLQRASWLSHHYLASVRGNAVPPIFLWQRPVRLSLRQNKRIKRRRTRFHFLTTGTNKVTPLMWVAKMFIGVATAPVYSLHKHFRAELIILRSQVQKQRSVVQYLQCFRYWRTRYIAGNFGKELRKTEKNSWVPAVKSAVTSSNYNDHSALPSVISTQLLYRIQSKAVGSDVRIYKFT
jgi:hypothetical protein